MSDDLEDPEDALAEIERLDEDAPRITAEAAILQARRGSDVGSKLDQAR